MPLTFKGRKVLNKFQLEYGKRKGRNIFFAYIKLNPRQTYKFHKI